MRKLKIVSSIKSYIIFIIILAFYFLLVTKEKSIYKIKKIIPYYKTNKGFLRKLLNNENKVIIKLNGTQGQNVTILGNFDVPGQKGYKFFNNSPPSQIKLNNKSISSSTNWITLGDNCTYTIEMLWNYTLTHLEMMFIGCQDIEWIDFSNFNFSQATNLSSLLNGCTKLKYVNFGNADSRKAEDLSFMFTSCSSLETVENFFTTFNVSKMDNLFFSCMSLKSLNLSNLYTPFLSSMVAAFAG